MVPAEGEPWRARIDLRVEDHGDPLAELRRLLGLQRAYELAGAGRRADGRRARPTEAGALYRRAAGLAPDSDELLFWAGLALAAAGDLEAGVAAVRRAAERHPGWLVLLAWPDSPVAPTFARRPARQASGARHDAVVGDARRSHGRSPLSARGARAQRASRARARRASRACPQPPGGPSAARSGRSASACAAAYGSRARS